MKEGKLHGPQESRCNNGTIIKRNYKDGNLIPFSESVDGNKCFADNSCWSNCKDLGLSVVE